MFCNPLVAFFSQGIDTARVIHFQLCPGSFQIINTTRLNLHLIRAFKPNFYRVSIRCFNRSFCWFCGYSDKQNDIIREPDWRRRRTHSFIKYISTYLAMMSMSMSKGKVVLVGSSLFWYPRVVIRCWSEVRFVMLGTWSQGRADPLIQSLVRILTLLGVT